jgi:hypothetical protein
MKQEEYQPTPTAQQARELVSATADDARVFVASREGDWMVLSDAQGEMDAGLASAIASESSATGWIVEPAQTRGHVMLWKVDHGQRADEPQDLTTDKATKMLKEEGVQDRLIDFKVREHLETEDAKRGRHEDVLLGFTTEAAKKETSEVERALGQAEKSTDTRMSLDQFLEAAIGHARVRAIAKAQIKDQLRRDGFNGELEIINPQPEGHFCESFEAESYSFTSNGPYVWFDWSCEEACEPTSPEEKAFPACDLKFSLEKSDEL